MDEPTEPPRRGRPPRESTEVVRTAVWYEHVRYVSKVSESKLEAEFDLLDRQARQLHKGSRWNKYKFGRTTPERDLLLRVERAYPGTLEVFDHPIWQLTAMLGTGNRGLKGLIQALPPSIRAEIVDLDAPPDSDFWAKQSLDHRESFRRLQSGKRRRSRPTHLHYYDVLAGFVALIHDAARREREWQHYEAHLALADYARSWVRRKEQPHAWRLEALILCRWLETRYRQPMFRRTLDVLKQATSTGPRPPWEPEQRSLQLGRVVEHKAALDLRDAKGYWIGLKLAEMSDDTGFWQDAKPAKWGIPTR